MILFKVLLNSKYFFKKILCSYKERERKGDPYIFIIDIL